MLVCESAVEASCGAGPPAACVPRLAWLAAACASSLIVPAHRPSADPRSHYHELIAALDSRLAVDRYDTPHRTTVTLFARAGHYANRKESDFTTNFLLVFSRNFTRTSASFYLEQIVRLKIRILARLALEFWRRYTTWNTGDAIRSRLLERHDSLARPGTEGVTTVIQLPICVACEKDDSMVKINPKWTEEK